MKAFFHKINQILSAFSGWLMLIMMVLLILDIVSRGVGRPFQGIAEMSVFVMMVVIYLGLARCEENDENVRIELILFRLPWKYKKFLLLFIDLVQVGVIGIFFFEMVRNTIVAFRTQEAVAGTVQFFVWPVKVFIVIGLFFYLMQILVNMHRNLRNLGRSDEPKIDAEKIDLSDIAF